MKKRVIAVVFCLMMLFSACGKTGAVRQLEKGIKAVGTVTADSKEQLDSLREAYDALTDEEKEAVNPELLTKLEKAEDRCAARIFEQRVDAIGTVTEDSGPIILELRSFYDGMTEGAREQVEPDALDTFLTAETEYDDMVAERILEQIKSAEKLSLEEAYEIAFSHTTRNEKLLELQKDIADLMLCDGVFYQEGNYKSELVIYLQYGEYWFDFDYRGYTGTLEPSRLWRERAGGDYLFRASTTGTHWNFLEDWWDTTSFELHFGEKRLYVAWGLSRYCLMRE